METVQPKEIILNLDSLDINSNFVEVRKARALIINDNNRIILEKYADMYLLPGGKVEDLEDSLTGVKREVKEELGIDLGYEMFIPFLRIKTCAKNYVTRNHIEKVNRVTITDYYIVKGEFEVDYTKMDLTEFEKQANIEIELVDFTEALKLVRQPSSNPKNKYFSSELEIVLNTYKEMYYEEVKKKKLK